MSFKTFKHAMVLTAVTLVLSMVVEPQAATPGEFVGVTTAITDGDAGIIVLNQMCAAEFNKSRFCTTKEVFETQNPDIHPRAHGWVILWYGVELT